LQRQYMETQAKLKICEDKLEQTEKALEETKRTKEDLYEKMMHAREAYKVEYDLKLNQELIELKKKTEHEIEKLRVSTKEFYEREILTLKESRDGALIEKERHDLTIKELQIKCQEAANELRLVQVSCENRVSELKSDVKLKTFELERARMLSDEHVTNHQKVLLENEKLQKKCELVQNEFYAAQMHNDKRFMEIESELAEKKARLANYEKVEDEMDAVIKQVAEASENGQVGEEEAERMLMSYGYGTNVMMSAKRKIQQNVHLTKRVLQLEQLNTTLRHELARERNSHRELEDQVIIL
jgi:progesterone-induced-blocking factor 1